MNESIYLQLTNAFIQVISKQDGKDKLLKTVQYLARILVTGLGNTRKTVNIGMLNSLSSNISLARRTFRLGSWLGDVQPLTTYKGKEFLFLFVSITNSILDDICCLYRHGIITNRVIFEFADLYSSRLWLVSIINDIYKTNYKIHNQLAICEPNSEEKIIQFLIEILLSLSKIYFDFGFCIYEVLSADFSPLFQQTTGMMAAACGLLKLMKKEFE